MSSEGEVEGREICEVVAGSHADLCLLQCSLHHVIWATSSVCSIGVFFGTGAPLDSGRFKLALREALCYYQDGRGSLMLLGCFCKHRMPTLCAFHPISLNVALRTCRYSSRAHSHDLASHAFTLQTRKHPQLERTRRSRNPHLRR